MNAADREDREDLAPAKETAGLLDGSGNASSRRPVETIEIDAYLDDGDTRAHAAAALSLTGRIQERFLLTPRLTLATALIGILSVYFLFARSSSSKEGTRRSWFKDDKGPPSYPAFPARQLLGIGNGFLNSTPSPYSAHDFQNGQNRTVRYWGGVQAAIEKYQSTSNVWNLSTWGPCYPRASNRQNRGTRSRHYLSNWTSIVQSASFENIVYPTQTRKKNLEGLCRPGYLLIGQGKCGTSSLYHYIAGHPRVLEAKKKQIHYFLYHRDRDLPWYLSNFGNLESFLGNGILMTGEASPGYLPYPGVVTQLVKRMAPEWKFAEGDFDVQSWRHHTGSLPKILAIVREPIDRALSSYKYNYVSPALMRLRSGRGVLSTGEKVDGKLGDEQYYQYLFSFEQLVRAELVSLRKCLAPGGSGEQWSLKKYRRNETFFHRSVYRELNDRNSTLISLDEACYVKTKSKNLPPREQWIHLAIDYPHKIIDLPNLHLIQSLVGRGVYVLPLEWWYEVFAFPQQNESNIQVFCMEDMASRANKFMDDVTAFLGLPDFDFRNVTEVGRYNVGGHRGYNTVLGKSNAMEKEETEKLGDDLNSREYRDLLDISDGLRRDLKHFYQPYNDRLFKLMGGGCPW